METNAQTNIQKSLIICNFECQRGGSGTKLDIAHDTNYANTHNIKKKNGSANINDSKMITTNFEMKDQKNLSI